MNEPLQVEMAFFADLEHEWFGSNTGPLAAHVCRHVLVHGREVVGSFPTFDGAYAGGVERFGVSGGFLVRQVVGRLADAVPATQVEVGVPAVVAATLERDDQAIPDPSVVPGLIDTGSGTELVDIGLLERLGLRPVDQTTIETTGGAVRAGVFCCRLSLPRHPAAAIFEGPVLGVPLAPRWGVVLGRSFLARTVYVHNGLDGYWTMDFSGREPERSGSLQSRFRRGRE